MPNTTLHDTNRNIGAMDFRVQLKVNGKNTTVKRDIVINTDLDSSRNENVYQAGMTTAAASASLSKPCG